MTDDNQDQLQQAYELIRQERFEEAQLLLQPIIFDEPSADAWWLWANAVTDPEDARHALSRVLEFEPAHPQARQLLTRLDEIYPAVSEPDTVFPAFDSADDEEYPADRITQPPIEADIPDLLPPDTVSQADAAADYDEDEPAIRQLERPSEDTETSAALDFSDWLDDLAESEEAGSPEQAVAADMQPQIDAVPPAERRSAFRSLLLVLLVLVIGIGLAVVLFNQLNDGSRTAGTDQREWTAITDPSEQLETVLQAAEQGLSTTEMGGTPVVRLVEYEDGTALLIEVCRGAGADLPEVLRAGMEQAARYGISAQDELSHVGVSLVNCERQDVLAEALASIDVAASFASGALNAAEYQASWEVTQQ